MAETPEKCLKLWIKILEEVWKDKECRKNFIKNSFEFLHQHGIKIPKDVTIKVHENTDQVRFLTLPQKPEKELSIEVIDALAAGWGVLFLSNLIDYKSKVGNTHKLSKWATIVQKAWENSDFKQTLLKNPDMVLRENGIHDPTVAYKVHENSTNHWNLTLPLKPERKLSDQELHAIAAGFFG